ncbi:protein-tyrosine-phosphatase [Novosphingobium sp. PC22D]|uniref:tyrosine-protein phosphatase n=1 Tax=Novosphingobium sp. PC22D TaxID=1962403 RepID=UPI000BF1089F|nr:tyrosine-protein phosphatase [Novosphingobium sp. PC22D]PEQ10642.1 protein-tyrosine-phosphatase [Novosphingobium sp. PC22D]
MTHTEPSSRVIELEGVHNFRDFGGYRVAGGGRLRRGILWRSGQHSKASEADLAAIDALGLSSVFDLRTDRERASHPCRRPAGFSATIHHAQDPGERHAPHIDSAKGLGGEGPESVRRRIVEVYGVIAFRPELQAMVGKHLVELSEDRGPSLVNCMAGKDRTGIAVAIVQLAAGVHRDDIFEDFMLTNTAGNSEARVAAGMETIRAISPDADEAAMRVLMGVEPQYLEAAFAAIEERHGSTDAFLEAGLGFGAARRERLREALVES